MFDTEQGGGYVDATGRVIERWWVVRARDEMLHTQGGAAIDPVANALRPEAVLIAHTLRVSHN